MFIPAPTDAITIVSGLLIVCSGNLPFSIRSSKVGMVATELLPSYPTDMGIIPAGIWSLPNSLKIRSRIPLSIFSLLDGLIFCRSNQWKHRLCLLHFNDFRYMFEGKLVHLTSIHFDEQIIFVCIVETENLMQ